MKQILILVAVALAGCNDSDRATVTTADKDTIKVDNTRSDKDDTASIPAREKTLETGTKSKIYSNKRFKDVTVEKTGEQTFLIKGKGQIFEASFSWVIEDGHDELKKGFEMTEAGAPEWGNFSFTVDAVKTRPNSTLHLILFESSAKDGSRQYELPILLY